MTLLPEPVSRGFQTKWGINDETLATWGIIAQEASHLPAGVRVGFPYLSPTGELVATKWRFQNRDGEREFRLDKTDNFRYWPWGVERLGAHSGPVVLTEGETDAMRLSQELPPEYLVLAMPGTLGWQSFWEDLFKDHKLYVVFDNDAARLGGHGYGGDEADVKKVTTAETQVTKTWRKIKAACSDTRRVKLPEGLKDVCEYFQAGYDGDEFIRLIEEADVAHETRLAQRASLATCEPDNAVDQINELVPATGFLRDYLNTFSPTTEASDSYILGAALSVMGTALGGLRLEIGAQRVPLNLYTLIIGRTTVSRKSTTLATARRVLEGTGLPAIGDGFSPEGLETFLTQNPSTLINFDEYKRSTDTASKGYGVDLPTVLTSAYGGYLYPRVLQPKRDKDGNPSTMEKPDAVRVNVNLLGASTEDWLDGLNSTHIRSGFLARHLLLFDSPMDKKWLAWPKSPNNDDVIELRRYVSSFTRDCRGLATFDDEAREYVSKWYFNWREHFEAEPNDLLQAWWARYDTLARKIACLIEISQNPGPDPVVSLDSTKRALAVIDGVLERIKLKLDGGLFAEGDQIAVARITRHLALNERADEIDLANAAELSLSRLTPVLDAMVRAGRLERLNGGEQVSYALPD